MRLSDFIMLDEEQKKLIVLHEGVLIGKRVNIDFMVFLFQMESYYVETFCNRDNKAIQEFRIFDNMKPLAPYLDAISIDDLLN
jgi:hypothetical protein